MPRFPKAKWRGPVPNRTPSAMIRPIMGLVLHVEQGTEAGSDSWFHNSKAQASAHFGNPLAGPLDQWVDTNDKAWAEVAGNARWISVEHEGYSGKPPAPTKSQIENDAQLLAWLHVHEGVPLQVTNSVSRRGLGWHGMGGTAWGGHLDCPGDRIKNARAEIIRRAEQIVAEGNKPAPPLGKHKQSDVADLTGELKNRKKPVPHGHGTGRTKLRDLYAQVKRLLGIKS